MSFWRLFPCNLLAFRPSLAPPFGGRSFRSGAWSWCSRALVPPGALLRSPTAVLAAAPCSPPGRLRRPAVLPFGRARRCGGLPPGSASPPRPSRGLARSGVPPSRLGRAVALSRCFYVRCRLRRPLLCRLAAAGCIQGWAIGACMNLAFARLEPCKPLSPCMQSFCRRKGYCSKYILFNYSVKEKYILLT